MLYEELVAKYQELLLENESLKRENRRLKDQLGISKGNAEIDDNQSSPTNAYNQNEEIQKRVSLFMSLFRGRDDVYAKGWKSKEGKTGYAPVCKNEWKPKVCNKPKSKCSVCQNRVYQELNEQLIENHLRGNLIIGIYPMCLDETSWFLAIDFDDIGWQKDVTVLREVCAEFKVPIAVERSRSGNGAHVWCFFETPIAAGLARKMGSSILTYAMNKRHEIRFQSYDRFFPNQDTMPKGGLGNLIALPLQMEARKNGNSVFVDEEFKPYGDQWGFLKQLQKLTEEDVVSLTRKLSARDELGSLKSTEDEPEQNPWETQQIQLIRTDFPESIAIVVADMLYIKKEDFSQRALNQIKRLAAFKNPQFYKAQAMRLPTHDKPRIISCAHETAEYLCLPRGCAEDIKSLFCKFNVQICWTDRCNPGNQIDVEFKGMLREEQQMAINELLKVDNGVLSATTAFGKTVVAANLIAQRKVNTLILVHRQQLLEQWQKRMIEFLSINEELPEEEKRRGRKKTRSLVGQLGAGKDNLSGIIDIAVMQSVNFEGNVKECVRNYGMVIIDECHHVPAISFEQILKKVNAKYIYGLTATPKRQDGHHPIIFLHCGPIRYRADAKKHAVERPFEHYVIPRFTGFKLPMEKEENAFTIQEVYTEIVSSELRNQLVVDDVVKNHEKERSSLILTERTAHVKELAQKLRERIPDVITLTGGMGTKQTKERLNQIANTPVAQPLTIVATGKYIGEGFDEPRLDTLFLVMPFSWEGTLQQYAGRLHRLFETKTEAQVYDYVDIHVKVLAKMYNKRLKGYASIGYQVKGEAYSAESIGIIFDKNSFWPVYEKDLHSTTKEILIVSPYLTRKRVAQVVPYLKAVADKKVKVTVITRPLEDFKQRGKEPLEYAVDLLKNAGITVLFRSNFHQKFAVFDQRVVWYGSINLLSFGSAEENVMRLESSNIANELLRSIGYGYPKSE